MNNKKKIQILFEYKNVAIGSPSIGSTLFPDSLRVTICSSIFCSCWLVVLGLSDVVRRLLSSATFVELNDRMTLILLFLSVVSVKLF